MVEPTESKGTPEAFGQGKTLPLLAAYAHSFSTALSSALDETFSLPGKGIGSLPLIAPCSSFYVSSLSFPFSMSI